MSKDYFIFIWTTDMMMPKDVRDIMSDKTETE